MIDFKKLQNGSDIRGVAIATENGPEVNLNKEVAGRIAGAFCYLLSKKVNKNPVMLKICVGQDSRLSGNELKEGILEAISLWGAEGYDAGLSTTPAMFMSTVLPQFEFDGAIMITASHLPFERNGFKFFSAEGWRIDEDVFRRLYGRFGGVTWYVQAVLNKVWETRTSLRSDAQVERAVAELRDERALVYHDLLAAQNGASRNLLAAIARTGAVKEPTSSAFLSANGLRVASTVRAALKDLSRKDLVYRSDDGWIVYDRLFAEWLRSLP